MKKEIESYSSIVENVLVVLTFISLIINAFYFTNHIYSLQSELVMINVEALNKFCENSIFNIILWIDNIMIYIVLIFYIIDTIKAKKKIFFKLSFAIFSFLTTLMVIVGQINLITEIFGVFN